MSFFFKTLDSKYISQIAETEHALFKKQSEASGIFLTSHLSEETLSKFFSDPKTIALGCLSDSGSIIGFILGSHLSCPGLSYLSDYWSSISWSSNISTSESIVWVEKLWVVEEARRLGIGKSLVSSLVSSLNNSQKVIAPIVSKPQLNSVALELFENCGFKIIGKFSSNSFRNISNYESLILCL